MPQPPRVWIPKHAGYFQLQRILIEHEALMLSGELPPLHADPFDRLLAAQALSAGFHLVSPDPPFRAYGAACVW